MIERDIRSVLYGLGLLIEDSKDAGKLQAMRNYAAVKAMCADLRRSAEEYKGTRNITMVISELENHMAAVAGLFPTWDLPKDQHLVGAHAAISKLAMGTCFVSRFSRGNVQAACSPSRNAMSLISRRRARW